MSHEQCLGCNMVVTVYPDGTRTACACQVSSRVRVIRSAYPSDRDVLNALNEKERVILNARYGKARGWACDCKVGGGNADALVHDQGCASQEQARRAPKVEVCT